MPIAPEQLSLLYTGPFPAYLYGRASRDPSKKGRSVDSQLREGREVCEENDWPVIGEFPDIDRSASRYARRGREKFEEMMEGIEAGKPRILVAFEASRYYRDLEVYLRLRNACMTAGVLLCYNGTVYDLSKRADRKATAQDALQAEDEAEGIRDRNLRTMRHNAKAGRPHGRLLYGYARRYDPDTGDLIEQYPHPERAKIVHEIFERYASGETIYSITRRLRARGERLPGITWGDFHVRSILSNASYMGMRIHRGKPIRKANWEAIVDPALFQSVQRILDGRTIYVRKDWSAKYLLSGIARCGECETEEGAAPLVNQKNRAYMSYSCRAASCVSLVDDKFEAYVEEGLLDYLSSKAAVAAFRSTDDEERAQEARSLVEALEAQLREARAKASTMGPDHKPLLSLDSLTAIETGLLPQIEDAKATADAVNAPPVLRGLVGQGRPDLERLWNDEMSIEQRRAVVQAVVNVRLFRARVHGVRRLEPGRITLTFYGEPGFIADWHRLGRVKAPKKKCPQPDEPAAPASEIQ